MRISVIGTGYVGLVTGACFAEMGNDVLCLDVDHQKVDMLRAGQVPIHEPGLEGIVTRNMAAGRLRFTSDVEASVAHGMLQIVGVGTPPQKDGSVDLKYVLDAVRGIGQHMEDYKVVVNKSTVPVGTADMVRAVIAESLAQRDLTGLQFSVVSNPEFLKEGAAVEDFMRPDRIIVGADDERAILMMRALYVPFMRNHDRMQIMDARSAEFTKYAANAMLATRISFMNELARLAEKVDADIEMVRRGIGSDPRIGTHFLYPGTGYGGSCFPKDVKALIHAGRVNGVELGVLQAVETANERQKHMLVEKIVARFGDNLAGHTFAVWGLAFKPNTDDMREAPSRVVVTELARRGAAVRAYDPVAMGEARVALAGTPNLTFVEDHKQALEGADALVVVTEWKEFRNPDFGDIKAALKQPLIFDGRNLYEPALMKDLGIEYVPTGRPRVLRS
jgi:UDPglucose 6-dehydrogenase